MLAKLAHNKYLKKQQIVKIKKKIVSAKNNKHTYLVQPTYQIRSDEEG